MKYTVHSEIFNLEPTIKFGILIGKNIRNSPTSAEDEARLRQAELRMQELYKSEQVRELPMVAFYRDIMSRAGINPNKFPPSVEAMYKRILKGGQLPTINAVVDLCNAVSIEQVISLGAHDLADINTDLDVRYSITGDKFLPFGSTEWEAVDAGEIIFTAGNEVQTRKWLWRQSELGKTAIDSNTLIFQLVGYGNDANAPLYQAMNDIKKLIVERFNGSYSEFIVDINNRIIHW